MSDDDNIIREVEDDLRRERYERLWKQYGPFVIGTIVAVVLGMAGWQLWQAHQERQREREAEAFIAASELLGEDKPAEAARAFAELAEKAGPGYRAMARMHEAEAWLEHGNPDSALAAFDAVTADGSADAGLRGLAALKGALLLGESASPEDLKKRLTPALRPASPWRFSAQEVVAYAHYRTGQTEEARNAYQALVNEHGAPGHIRDRARRMLALMASEAARGGDGEAPGEGETPPSDEAPSEEGGDAAGGAAGAAEAPEESAPLSGGGTGDTAASGGPAVQEESKTGEGP